jgi:uncharacterized protein (TIGR02996 family)
VGRGGAAAEGGPEVNEDEAFIRAIVDNPGDDLPRLVYADWLDDRDDPRGPYLRAEHEWAKPWRAGERPRENAELHKLAANLDPVWVARVSRPPMGVCLTHIGITRSKEVRGVTALVTRDELASFEQDLNIKLPAEYAAFLLNQNGGKLEKCSVQVCRRVEVELEGAEAGDEEYRELSYTEADDEEYSGPLYNEVPAGRADIVLTFYPIRFSYREMPEYEWNYAVGITVEETDNPGAMIQADLYKYIAIGKNSGAIPGIYRLMLEDYTDEGGVGSISHYPTRSTRRRHYWHVSLAGFLASLIPRSRADAT